MNICNVLSPDRIIVGVQSRDKLGVLQEMLEVAATSGKIRDKAKLFESILERERLQTTGVGFGLAIAHARTDDVEDIVLSLGISKEGVNYDALDQQPVHIIFLLVAAPDKNMEYLSVLAKIARLFKQDEFREAVKQAGDPASVMNLLQQREEGRCT
jgi:nitrogen PTS system EIIA component